MMFHKSDDGIIKIDIFALNTMHKYIQNSFYKVEAGGVLLGRFLKDSSNIVIDKVTIPMKNDRCKRFSFFRDFKLHQQIIENEWALSNGTCVYLGEWHTHPEDIPTPSSVDYRNWECKLKNDTYNGDYLYFIIVGIKVLRIWEGNKQNLTFNLGS